MSAAMNKQEMIANLEALAPWHLDFEITPGIRTAMGNASRYGDKDHRGAAIINPWTLQRTIELLFPGGFEGKSFLDAGCNSGGYCFLLKSMGAARTLGFDAREHWIRQAEFVRQQWEHSTEGMEFRTARLGEIDLDPPFDLTLAKGILYHLPNPIGDLLTLCAATREAIIVNSACRSDIPEGALLSGREDKNEIMSGVDGLCWYPGGPQAIVNILRHAGFYSFSLRTWRREGKGARPEIGRFELVAARSPLGEINWSAGGYGRG
jgi:2-polyprenyl-3-methyl-5-hydroxy-6-metoxy-1,4-benzoquinol methylase